MLFLESFTTAVPKRGQSVFNGREKQIWSLKLLTDSPHLVLKEGEISVLDVIPPADLARKLLPLIHLVFK